MSQPDFGQFRDTSIGGKRITASFEDTQRALLKVKASRGCPDKTINVDIYDQRRHAHCRVTLDPLTQEASVSCGGTRGRRGISDTCRRCPVYQQGPIKVKL